MSLGLAMGCAGLAGIDDSYELDPGSASGASGGATSGAAGKGMGGSGGVGAGGVGAGGSSGLGGAAGMAAMGGAAGQGGSSGSAGTGADSGMGGVGGGAGGVGGVGGAAGTTSECASGCTSGLEGPPLVRIASANPPFCIDAREVTNAEYARFLMTNPSIVQPIIACQASNLTFAPTEWPVAPARAGHPVTGVDWCDAWGYCRWAGKRLCGRIGGGTLGSSDFADPTKSQWMNACSAGGSREYPYGAAYSAGACNGRDLGVGSTAPGFATAGCFGACDRLFDMSGNVAEWEDGCSVGNTVCRVRGGSFVDVATALACAAARTEPHLFASPSVGFRCCAD